MHAIDMVGSARAAVAQWIERWSSKPGVAGSNPAGGMSPYPPRARLLRYRRDVTILSVYLWPFDAFNLQGS